MTDYRPRLSIELEDHEDFFALQRLFPHGLMKPFFNVLVKEVITLLEHGGSQALALVIHKQINIKELIPTLNEISLATEKGEPPDDHNS